MGKEADPTCPDFALACRHQRHVDPVGVRLPAQDHAAQRAHVREVAAPGDGNMVLAGDQIVGRVEMDPAGGRAAPQGDPGVAGVAAPRPWARSAATMTWAKSWQPPALPSNTSCRGVEMSVAPG